MSVHELLARYYPEPAQDGTVVFYEWLRAACTPDSVVLNVGAGPETKTPDRVLKGAVRRVVGVDIDPVVTTNAELDEAHVTDGVTQPFPDNFFDVAFADYVLEHVEHPRPFLAEIYRVLKPGGAFFFRTPNTKHYVSIVSALTPHWFHRLVANRVRNLPSDAHDPWPTFYRMNSRSRIARIAKVVGFSSTDLRMVEAAPSYLQFNRLAFLVGVGYERVVNSHDFFAGVRANVFGRIVK